MTPLEIVTVRGKLGLSQAALARELGVGVGAVSRWERGVAKPPSYLGLALTDLVRGHMARQGAERPTPTHGGI